MQTGGNAVLSGQQKQQNVPAGHVIKVVAFLNGVYKPMDFGIDIGNDNEIFSSHWTEKAYISAN